MKLFYDKSSLFKRNFLRVASANVISQLILLAALPVLPRLFSPEDFAIAAVFSAFIAISVSFVTWQHEKFIPLTHAFSMGANLYGLGTLCLAIFTIILTILLLLEIRILDNWLQRDLLGAYVYLLPFAVFSRGQNRLLTFWHVRKGSLESVGQSKIIQSLTEVLLSILAGLLSMGPGGLVTSAALSSTVALYPLVRCSSPLKRNIYSIKWRRMLDVGVKRLPSTSMASLVVFTNSTSNNIAVIFLALVFHPTDVGVYALVRRAMVLPVGIVSSAMSLSFWGRASQLVKERKLRKLKKLYFKVLGLLSALSVCLAVCAYLFSGIVEIVFGEDWAGSGAVLVVLIPLMCGTLIFSSTNHLIALERQPLQLIADGFRILSIGVIVLFAKIYGYDFLDTLLLISVASFFGYLVLMFLHIYVYRRLSE